MYLILVMLIVASAFAHASPKGEPSPSKNVIQVVSEPGLLKASERLVSAYNQSGPAEPVTASGIVEPGIPERLNSEGTLALVTKNCFTSLDCGERWHLVIARDVVIPVMNSNHPDREEIDQHGISPQKFYEMICLSGSAYVGSEPGVAAFVADFLGTEQGSIPAAQLISGDQLLEMIRKNPETIGFIRLPDVLRAQNSSLPEGLGLVPIDLNGNGELNHAENIYHSVTDLVRGIAIGKYPNTLSSRVYAVGAKKSVQQGEIAFVEWLMHDGQGILNEYSLMALSNFERESELRSLLNEPVVAPISVPAPASASKVVLLICGILLGLLLLFTFILNMISRRSAETAGSGTVTPSFDPGSLSFPPGYFFDKTHAWTFMEKDGNVRLGLDDFLLHITGPVTRIEMKKPGESVKKGEPLCKIIQEGKQLEIRSPLSGTVTETNKALKEDSNVINTLPYSEGWVYLIKPQNWLTELKGYFIGSYYREWITGEFTRLKDFFSKGIGLVVRGIPVPVIQDGGEVKYGILEEFGPEVWEEFQTKFINPPGCSCKL